MFGTILKVWHPWPIRNATIRIVTAMWHACARSRKKHGRIRDEKREMSGREHIVSVFCFQMR